MGLVDETGDGAVEVLDPRDVAQLETGLLARVVDDQRAAAEDAVVQVLLEGDVVDAAQGDDPSGARQDALLLDRKSTRLNSSHSL